MRKAPILATAALLAGCNLAPHYVRPGAPVAPTYPAATATVSDPKGAPVADDLGWRDFFLDPQLRALIEAGIARNRDLAQSVARIAQARARLGIQDSQRLPNADLNAGATRNRTPLNSLGFGDAVPGGDGPSAIKVTQYDVNVGVASYELDFWGRLRNLSRAERLRWLGSIEGARAARLTVIANIASTWFDIRSGEERIAIAEQALAGRRRGVAIARDRLDAGVTSTIDFDQTVLLQKQAEAELADVRRATEQSRNLLDVLIGGPLSAPLPPRLANGLPQVRPIAAGLPSTLLANRPDIVEAEYNLRAANANIGALRAAFFPTITLTGAFGYASPVLSGLLESSSTSWNFGGAGSLPLLDWGRRRAQLREGRAQARELVATYQKATQGAFREVADALVGRRRYQEQIVAQQATLVTQRRLVEAARLRYDQGISIYLQVLDAERNLFTTEQQLIQLRATALQNAVTLYTALGGGAGDRAAPFPLTLE